MTDIPKSWLLFEEKLLCFRYPPEWPANDPMTPGAEATLVSTDGTLLVELFAAKAKDSLLRWSDIQQDSVRAVKAEEKLTISFVGTPTWEYVGDYVDKKGGGPVKAYRQLLPVTVVYWPEKECAGIAQIRGEEPPGVIFDHRENADARRGRIITPTDVLLRLNSLSKD